MTSIRQIDANRRNARKSTGPTTVEGKQRSRCNAVRHGLTAETIIGALEDADDYKAFEAAIIRDYEARSVVERELVLRLASLLWRLRRASTIETGLFEIQAEHLANVTRAPPVHPDLQRSVYVTLEQLKSVNGDTGLSVSVGTPHTEAPPHPVIGSGGLTGNSTIDLARCFLRLANLPSYALDRIARYEATLWRQAAQILIALDGFDRRKLPEQRPRFRLGSLQDFSHHGDNE
jgi:hypothetical protein